MLKNRKLLSNMLIDHRVSSEKIKTHLRFLEDGLTGGQKFKLENLDADALY